MHSEIWKFKATIFARVKFYLFAYGWVFFYLYVYMDNKDWITPLIIFTFIEVLSFFSTAYKSNYCIVENDVLTIKNHILLWKNKTYDLKKIYSIDYTHISRAGLGLKIKLRNLPASTQCLDGLSRKSFIQLYKLFKQYNIKLNGFTQLDKDFI